jgi:transposase
MPHPETGRRITVGVDTHADTHVAVALDQLGARLDELPIPTTQAGYDQLEHWAISLGPVDAFGVEGTGSYGAELARVLRRRGYRIIEVNRPDRATRHRRGKSDPIDAEMAARAVLAGTAAGTPKHADGDAEMVRMLKMAKDSAVKTRTQALNQIKAILVTAPAQLRESLAGLSVGKLLDRCAAFEPGELTTPTAVAQHTLRLLARRNLDLRAEVKALQADIARLATRAAPTLLDVFGVGPRRRCADPRHRRRQPAAATLRGRIRCAVRLEPDPRLIGQDQPSSGKTNRHRLNRGGDRQANATLHRIAVVRLRWHEPTQKYMARRLAEGKSKAEIMRCLKRFIAREIYQVLCPTPRHGTTGKDLAQAAWHL